MKVESSKASATRALVKLTVEKKVKVHLNIPADCPVVKHCLPRHCQVVSAQLKYPGSKVMICFFDG